MEPRKEYTAEAGVEENDGRRYARFHVARIDDSASAVSRSNGGREVRPTEDACNGGYQGPNDRREAVASTVTFYTRTFKAKPRRPVI